MNDKTQNIEQTDCHYHDKLAVQPTIDEVQLNKVANMLKALADSSRLNLLLILQYSGEICVSELVNVTGDKMTTVSNRLKLLHDAGLVSKRRDGQHILYALEDEHIEALLANLLAHAHHLS